MGVSLAAVDGASPFILGWLPGVKECVWTAPLSISQNPSFQGKAIQDIQVKCDLWDLWVDITDLWLQTSAVEKDYSGSTYSMRRMEDSRWSDKVEPSFH